MLNNSKEFMVEKSLYKKFLLAFPNLRERTESHGQSEINNLYSPSKYKWVSLTDLDRADKNNFIVWDGFDAKPLEKMVGLDSWTIETHAKYGDWARRRLLEADIIQAKVEREKEHYLSEVENYKKSKDSQAVVASKYNALSATNLVRAAELGVIPQIYSYQRNSQQYDKEDIRFVFGLHLSLGYLLLGGFLAEVREADDEVEDILIVDLTGVSASILNNKNVDTGVLQEPHVSSIFTKSLSPEEGILELEEWAFKPYRQHYSISIPFVSGNPTDLVNADWGIFLSNLIQIVSETNVRVQVLMGDIDTGLNTVMLHSLVRHFLCEVCLSIMPEETGIFDSFLVRFPWLPSGASDIAPPLTEEEIHSNLVFKFVNNRVNPVKTPSTSSINRVSSMLETLEEADYDFDTYEIEDYV